MKKTKLLIFLIGIISCLFVGCQASNVDESNSTDKSEIRVITDAVGREVKIPTKVEKIVPLGNTPRMITYLGLSDKVVGISGLDPDKISPVQAYAYANKDLWSSLPVVGTDAGGATDYYPEQIIQVKPDIILCTYTKELADEIQSKTNIPVVAVSMGTLFAEDYNESLRMLGDVCGVKDRAEEVVSYINDCLDDLNKRTKEVDDSKKPTALAAAATFKGAHGIEGVYSQYAVFKAVAANDVTHGILNKSGGVLVDKEKIIDWNPDIIFLDSGGVSLVNADYKKNPDFYSKLSAVDNKNIYQYPSSTAYFSNLEIPIANSYYVGSILYPEQFKDIDFKEKANEICKFFLGVDDYYSVLEKSSFGYGKVTLGNENGK